MRARMVIVVPPLAVVAILTICLAAWHMVRFPAQPNNELAVLSGFWVHNKGIRRTHRWPPLLMVLKQGCALVNATHAHTA